MAYSGFKNSMDFYKRDYFERINGNEWTPKERFGSNAEYDALMRNIIKALYDYERRVSSFERSYGSSFDEYYRERTRSSSKPFETKKTTEKVNAKQMEKEWDKQNDRVGYTALSTIPSFIDDVEKTLDKIRKANDKQLVLSDALDVISSKSTGIPSIDADNRRLADAFKASIEKETREFTKKTAKETDDDIADLKDSTFYKWKIRHGAQEWIARPGRPLATPENQPIYDDSGMTFKEIFQKLRELSRELTMATPKHYENKDDSSLRKTFQEKISGFKTDIERVSQYTGQIEKGMHDYEVYLTHEENVEARKITSQIGQKILELKDSYEDIIVKQQKYNKILSYIEAIKEREKAIDEVLIVLRSNRTDAFPKTIDMLQAEKLKCVEFLKKHEDTVRLFDQLFHQFDKKASEIESLMSQFNGIMLEGQKKKDADIDKKLKDKEHTEKLVRACEIERIQPEIDKIKQEIIRQMALEGYKPLSFDKGDYEHFREDYTAYNKVFIQRLKSELSKRGINYEGADLSNPNDTEFYQIMQEREGEKISVVTKANQEPVLKDVGHHSYMMTSDYYRYVFNLMKTRLDQSGRNYDYDDVEELAKEYIDRQYGLDQIRNQDEFQEIMIHHLREFGGKRTGK